MYYTSTFNILLDEDCVYILLAGFFVRYDCVLILLCKAFKQQVKIKLIVISR